MNCRLGSIWPNLQWATATGILLGASVMTIVAQRPTEFLYFRS